MLRTGLQQSTGSGALGAGMPAEGAPGSPTGVDSNSSGDQLGVLPSRKSRQYEPDNARSLHGDTVRVQDLGQTPTGLSVV